MKHLAQRGIPVPDPAADAEGTHPAHTEQQAGRRGQPLARAQRPGPRRPATAPRWAPRWRACTWPRMISRCPAQPARPVLVERDGAGGAALSSTPPRPHCCAANWPTRTTSRRARAMRALPRGPVHADLFRDNVMFEPTPVTSSPVLGFFDFYFRRRRHLAVRHRGLPERLVRRLGQAGTTTGRARAVAAGLCQAYAPWRPPSASPAAGRAARRRPALLDLAPVGPAPAARSQHAQAARSRPTLNEYCGSGWPTRCRPEPVRRACRR
jgi:hypothetical protein